MLAPGGGLTAVHGVDSRERDEEAEVRLRIMYPVDAKEYGGQDRHAIFAAVDKVREDVLGVVVTADALQSAPYGRESTKEPHQPRMVRVALRWVVPPVCVKTEEKLDVLRDHQRAVGEVAGSRRYGAYLHTWHMSANTICRQERSLETPQDRSRPKTDDTKPIVSVS